MANQLTRIRFSGLTSLDHTSDGTRSIPSGLMASTDTVLTGTGGFSVGADEAPAESEVADT
jgi:Leucine-rich repeat (LRR) protein